MRVCVRGCVCVSMCVSECVGVCVCMSVSVLVYFDAAFPCAECVKKYFLVPLSLSPPGNVRNRL